MYNLRMEKMTENILIIDDDSDFRTYLVTLLRENKFSVEEAESGKIAFNKVKSFIPDIIITDIVMPEMDGIEIIRKMKEFYPKIKIIAVSGGGKIDSDIYLQTAKLLKADKVLKKPFKKDELLGDINKLLSDV